MNSSRTIYPPAGPERVLGRTEACGSRNGRVNFAPRKDYRIDSRCPCGSVDGWLLISETALFAAIRTSPGNSVARHPPQVLLHALRAYLKTAATCPAERHFLAAQVAKIFLFLSPSGSWPAFDWLGFHLVILK